MRKIRAIKTLNPVTFEPMFKLLVRDEKGDVHTFKDTLTLDVAEPPKYSPEEMALITEVNQTLKSDGYAIMTEEEEQGLISGGSDDYQTEITSIDELTRLSGYEVAKEITPFGTQTSSRVQEVAFLVDTTVDPRIADAFEADFLESVKRDSA